MHGWIIGTWTALVCMAPGTGAARAAEEPGGGLYVGPQPVDAIVVERQASRSETEAADALEEYVEKMAGVKLKRLDDTGDLSGRRGAIFLAQAALRVGGSTPEEADGAGYEGYRIRTRDGDRA